MAVSIVHTESARTYPIPVVHTLFWNMNLQRTQLENRDRESSYINWNRTDARIGAVWTSDVCKADNI